MGLAIASRHHSQLHFDKVLENLSDCAVLLFESYTDKQLPASGITVPA